MTDPLARAKEIRERVDALDAEREQLCQEYLRDVVPQSQKEWSEFRAARRVPAHELAAWRRLGRPSEPSMDGEVVVTKNEAGQIVAVTRQDPEGRILEVIAESQFPQIPRRD